MRFYDFESLLKKHSNFNDEIYLIRKLYNDALKIASVNLQNYTEGMTVKSKCYFPFGRQKELHYKEKNQKEPVLDIYWNKNGLIEKIILFGEKILGQIIENYNYEKIIINHFEKSSEVLFFENEEKIIAKLTYSSSKENGLKILKDYKIYK